MSTAEEQDYVEYVSTSIERLRRTAYLLTNDLSRADDIVASTLLSVYLHWSRIRTVENLDGYVHRILVRRYVDESRRWWSRILLARPVPEQVAKPAASTEDAQAIRDALATLGRGQRAVLVLRFFCDMSVAETAAVLHCSTGNVKSQTARGLATMRRLLREQWSVDEGAQFAEVGEG
ncbi:SigE family RNA polymerase sigma factor [Plantactinospora endophytica]|uniref:RNA polymerase sigma24 factor n=1 Tax=Plantactinospora endophytica TaxID=673535 RepID=A0ABQ4DSQ0_9ACTN|nr:SigE family RNA polymerase sigma factor [Plantactinospora endophytica]GIG85469.1 RNA polymerase sigma24 factor [Plantactinospora endophytica]